MGWGGGAGNQGQASLGLDVPKGGRGLWQGHSPHLPLPQPPTPAPMEEGSLEVARLEGIWGLCFQTGLCAVSLRLAWSKGGWGDSLVADNPKLPVPSLGTPRDCNS